MSKTPINERIKFIAENVFDGNKSKMGDSIGLDYQNINNWISKKSKPKFEAFINLYISIQDKINPLWYLLGIGEPLLQKDNNPMQVSEQPAMYKSAYYEKIIAEKEMLIANQQELIELLKKQNK